MERTRTQARVAVHALRRREPSEIVVAVPIAPFVAIGVWYEQFPQISDEEIRDLLNRADGAGSS